MLASRFKVLLADAGLSIDEAGKLLHVTPRTVRYWISGKVGIPYAAYKLVRVLRWFELPGKEWAGWHMHSGKLWSPEGHGFNPHDSNWWGLLVRRSVLFSELYGRNRQLENLLLVGGRSDVPASGMRQRPQSGSGQAVPSDAVGRAPQAPRPNLFIAHFRKWSTSAAIQNPSVIGETQNWTGQSLRVQIPHGENQGVRP